MSSPRLTTARHLLAGVVLRGQRRDPPKPIEVDANAYAAADHGTPLGSTSLRPKAERPSFPV